MTQNNIIPITVSDLDEELNETNINSLRYAYENLFLNWSSGYSELTGHITINQSNDKLIIDTSLGIGTFKVNVTVKDNYENHSGNSW